jgi:hypothetical protein
VTHYSRISKIVIDVAPDAHEAEVEFWRAATAAPLQRFEKYPEYHGADIDHHIGLLIQRLDDGDSRIHLDIHATDAEAEVIRLEALGAQRVRQTNGWWIMRDPAGMLFCVIPDPRLDDTNATRWD